MRIRLLVCIACCVGLCVAAVPVVAADTVLSEGLAAKVDHIAGSTLQRTGVPSASIAIVKHDHVVYLSAYGHARLDPDTPATTSMRYSVGSISKQFTAAAIMLLQQRGKVSVDDPVSRFFPKLTRADDVSLRQLLSHTSGYMDYWAEDYVMPRMHTPTTVLKVIHDFAERPLDFEPGTQWQYSNTNYAILGAIVHKLTGVSPFVFLQKHVFEPLGMDSVWNVDVHPLPAADAHGYERYAMGPLRAAPEVGRGWVYGAGELAMTPADLAKWDISMLKQSVLEPASYRAMETEVRLRNGLGSGYGFGLFVGALDGHRMVSHDGEVPGFTATNMVFPDDGMAVVVLTNQDAIGASGQIATAIAKALFVQHNPIEAQALARARRMFARLQHGKLDRSQLTANANDYFSATAITDYRHSLAPLGPPETFVQTSWGHRGGMVWRRYRATFVDHAALGISTYIRPDGKLEQYIVAPE